MILPHLDEEDRNYSVDEENQSNVDDDEMFRTNNIDKLGEAKRMALVEIILNE